MMNFSNCFTSSIAHNDHNQLMFYSVHFILFKYVFVCGKNQSNQSSSIHFGYIHNASESPFYALHKHYDLHSTRLPPCSLCGCSSSNGVALVFRFYCNQNQRHNCVAKFRTILFSNKAYPSWAIY
eukprot:27443_1